MSRTESPDEVSSSRPRISSESAAKVGRWAAQLAGYGAVTIAVTFMLLRPRRGSGKRGSLFLGSGILMVLVKSLLSVGDGSEGKAAPAPTLAAATPAPIAAPAPGVKPAPAPRRRPANTAVVTPPKAQPAETKPKQAQSAVAVGEPAKSKPTKPVAASKPTVAPKPTPKAVAPARPAAPLGPRYADKGNGYSVQFPAGWSANPSTEAGWILDATDGQSAVLSIGFSKFPAHVSLDQVPADRVTRGLQKRAGTVVHSSGYSTVSGRRCLWHKFTGPITCGGEATKMTAVHYFLPLQDGRALELRMAAPPDKFNEMAPRMKQSVATFKLLTRLADAGE